MPKAANRYEAETGIVPIPLRADVTVKISGLPADLTQTEAKRIAAVINALAAPTA